MIKDYIDLGWALTPIKMGTKAPDTKGWNLLENAIRDEAQLDKLLFKNVGLLHAYSGTCAIDIDDLTESKEFFKSHSFDIDELFDTGVQIASGNPNHNKFIYKCSPKETKKIMNKGKTILEFRSASHDGASVQDLLPPSTHPSGKKYQWIGDFHNLPEIPERLLSIWDSLTQVKESSTSELRDNVIFEFLQVIPADAPRDEWISVGMALHHYGLKNNSTMFEVWDNWSSKGAKYPGQKELKKQWASFKDCSSPRTVATIRHIAEKYGYTEDYSKFFGKITAVSEDLIVKNKPVAPEVPVELFPKELQAIASEISKTRGCDILVPLWAGLGAASGAIDARSRLTLMPGFKVPPVLWLMTIGSPGDKKTPGSTPMMEPLSKLERSDRMRYQEALAEWEFKEAEWAAAKKAELEFASKAESKLSNVKPPYVPPRPPKPIPLTLTVSDITSQKLVRDASERPEGLLCYLDEMASWFKKMSNPTSGEDRSAWVKAHDCLSYKMDRVGGGRFECENLAISIYGNVQPAILKTNVHMLASDGLLQRFIPAILRLDKRRMSQPLRAEWMSKEPQWLETITNIHKMGERQYKLSNEAFKTFRRFQEWFEQFIKDEVLIGGSDAYITSISKLEGIIGRFTLVFHMIEDPASVNVSDELIIRVIDLAHRFIIPSLRYVYKWSMSEEPFDYWLMDLVLQFADTDIIKCTEIRRRMTMAMTSEGPYKTQRMVIDAMEVLESMNWVRRVDYDQYNYKNNPEWAIHPGLKDIMKDRRMRIIEAKMRLHGNIFGRGVHGQDDLRNG